MVKLKKNKLKELSELFKELNYSEKIAFIGGGSDNVPQTPPKPQIPIPDGTGGVKPENNDNYGVNYGGDSSEYDSEEVKRIFRQFQMQMNAAGYKGSSDNSGYEGDSEPTYSGDSSNDSKSSYYGGSSCVQYYGGSSDEYGFNGNSEESLGHEGYYYGSGGTGMGYFGWGNSWQDNDPAVDRSKFNYSNLEFHFKKIMNMTHDKFIDYLGGEIKAQHEIYPHYYLNTCAFRMSCAFNNIDILKIDNTIKGRAFRGKKEKGASSANLYYASVKDLDSFLSVKIPDCVKEEVKDGNLENIKGRKGIIIIHTPQYNHIDLWNGDIIVHHTHMDDSTEKGKRVYFIEIPD